MQAPTDPEAVSRPLRASLEAIAESPHDLPSPSRGVRWQSLTDIASHLALTRLSRGSLIRLAKAHHERVGIVDTGGRGLWRTTPELMSLMQKLRGTP